MNSRANFAQQRGVYAITPAWSSEQEGLAAVEAVLQGGVRMVQYRDKTADSNNRLQRARALLALCQRYGALCIINDDVELAVAVDADGAHVGGEDMPVAQARARLGEGKIVGASCYNRLDLAWAAHRAGADYIAFGRFFASVTKPGDIRASVELLRQARNELDTPIVAIGGITLANAAPLVQAGAHWLAVAHGLFSPADPRQAARDFAGLWSAHGLREHGLRTA